MTGSMGMSMKRYLEAFHPHLYRQALYLKTATYPNLDTMAPEAVAKIIAATIRYPTAYLNGNPLEILQNMEAHAKRLKEEHDAPSDTTDGAGNNTTAHPKPESDPGSHAGT